MWMLTESATASNKVIIQYAEHSKLDTLWIIVPCETESMMRVQPPMVCVSPRIRLMQRSFHDYLVLILLVLGCFCALTTLIREIHKQRYIQLLYLQLLQVALFNSTNMKHMYYIHVCRINRLI